MPRRWPGSPGWTRSCSTLWNTARGRRAGPGCPPGAGCSGEDTDAPRQSRPGSGQGDGIPGEEMFDSDVLGPGGGPDPAGSARGVVECPDDDRSRLDTDPGTGQADRGTREEKVPRDDLAPTGGRSGPDRGAGLCPDVGASEPLPKEPGRGALPRTGTGEKSKRGFRPATAHHERGRQLPAPPSGPVGAVHPGTVRTGLRPETIRPGALGPRGTQREETSRRGRRTKTGGAAASAVADWRSL